MKQIPSRTIRLPARMHGLSLIELLISMVLGLLVVGAAIGIFMTNRQTYRATESLGRVQENARTSFELLSRDIREASGNPCNSGSGMALVNVINAFAANWWTNWGSGSPGNALAGFDGAMATPGLAFGTTAGARIAGTDALIILSGGDTAATVVSHDAAATQFTMSNATHGFQTGELLMVCGQDASGAITAPPAPGTIRQGAIFQMTNAGGTTAIRHATGGLNSTANLGLDGGAFTFGPNAVITRLNASRWYIGANGRGDGRSLYQSTRTAANVVVNQEVAEGVENLTLRYLLPGLAPGSGTYVDAAGVAGRWNEVTAVRIQATLEGQENIGTDGNPIQRQLMTVATLRNRNQ